MRTATLIESSHDWQGWPVVLADDRDGTQRLCGTVALLDEAVALAHRNGAQLIIEQPARRQMETAGCAPGQWPLDLNAEPQIRAASPLAPARPSGPAPGRVPDRRRSRR